LRKIGSREVARSLGYRNGAFLASPHRVGLSLTERLRRKS